MVCNFSSLLYNQKTIKEEEPKNEDKLHEQDSI